MLVMLVEDIYDLSFCKGVEGDTIIGCWSAFSVCLSFGKWSLPDSFLFKEMRKSKGQTADQYCVLYQII